MKSLSSGDSFEGITAFNSQSEHAMPIPFHSTVNSALIIIKSCFYAPINCIFHHFHPAHGRRPEARDTDPWWEYGTVEGLPGAAGPQPARIVKLGTASARKAAYADPPGTSACLAAGPAWRTTAVALDGLCRETTPPARPEGYGEKVSVSHQNFAASRETPDFGPTGSSGCRPTHEPRVAVSAEDFYCQSHISKILGCSTCRRLTGF